MFSSIALLVSVLEVVMASPIPSKQISRYENIILHKGQSHMFDQKFAPILTSLEDIQLKPLLDDFNSYPEYEFAYGVRDPVTGDHKDQWEKRVGDHVQGVYLFEEAGGTQRIVEYEADDKQGFRAKVTNVGKRLPEGDVKSSELNRYVQGKAATSYNILSKAN